MFNVGDVVLETDRVHFEHKSHFLVLGVEPRGHLYHVYHLETDEEIRRYVMQTTINTHYEVVSTWDRSLISKALD